MALKKIGTKFNEKYQEWYDQWEADCEHDISNLPSCNPGSTCLVKETGETIEVAYNGVWGGGSAGVTSWNDLTDKPFGVETTVGFTGDTRTVTFSTDDKGYAAKEDFILYGESRAFKMDGVFYVGVNVSDERPIEPVNADVYGYSCWKFYDADGNYGGAIVIVSTAGYMDVTEFHEFPANSEITIEYGEGGEVENIRTIDPKYLPEGETLYQASGETVTADEFNALLNSLASAGYIKLSAGL